MNITRVAFIGAGNRSIGHMSALNHLDDVEVVGIAELDEERAFASQQKANERIRQSKPAARPIQAKVFNDFRTMNDELDPDCFYFCLPPYVHGALDHQVIDLGKPILFEKPVAVDQSVANEIADHIRQSGIVNAAGYQKRYSSAIQKPRQMLQGVTIGMAISIRLSGLPGQPWWRVQSQSGGMLVEQHTHAVDLMRYLCGEIESAYAVGNTNLLKDVPNLDIFDVNACTVRFANGAPGIIGNSCAAPAGASVFPPHLVHVVAPDMVLSVNEKMTTIQRVGTDPTEIVRDEDDNFLMNRTFIEAVRSGQQDGILCDFAEAARTLAVTLACQRSAETGKPVELSELISNL
ncbi:Gfo/Idh/MocA family oxidoreductase [Chloroflexi bacterium TSY]|nr:Gfo/Idh/MocA family oxidoreductase [Chloroflexi bacterium TSY]